MIYEYFRATGADEAAQGLSDLFRKRLHDDDAQEFDTRRGQAPLAASDFPTENVSEGFTSQNYRMPFRTRNSSSPTSSRSFRTQSH